MRAGWYSRYWIVDVVVLALLALGTLWLFRVTDLDLRVAGLFYRPGSAGTDWPVKNQVPWRQLYAYGIWPAMLFAAGSCLYLACGAWRGRGSLSVRHAIFFVLAFALGPGLVVNTILKDHWGRPRPRQVVELGGRWEHRAAWDRTESGRGKSFPCGHASTGFYFAVFYFVWRRRRPVAAGLALGGALAYGGAVGYARMAAGAHFLSDVLWAAYLTFGISLVLYYFVLRIPWLEDAGGGGGPLAGSARRGVGVAAVVVVLALVGVSQLLVPLYNDFRHEAPVALVAGQDELRIDCSAADLTVVFTNGAALGVEFTGRVQGFGTPYKKIQTRLTEEPDVGSGVRVVRIESKKRGFFTELEAEYVAVVDAGSFGRVWVRVGVGSLILRGVANVRSGEFEVGEGALQAEGAQDSVRELDSGAGMRLSWPAGGGTAAVGGGDVAGSGRVARVEVP